MLIGYGVGTATYSANQGSASANAKVMPDGTAVVSAGTQDIGTGTYTVMRQIAADAIGLPYDKVTFLLGDTKLPQTPGSGGSMTAATTGSAVLKAGKAAKQKLIALAIADSSSPVHGLPVDAVEINDGQMFAKDTPSTGESISSLVTRQGVPSVDVTVMSSPDQDRTDYSCHSFGAVFTEVNVDPDLGSVRVARVVGVYGVGKRLNAKTAHSQLIGGMIFGIGMALLEEATPDLNSGRIMNADLAEYHVPVNADVPPMEVFFIDEGDPYVNPLGIKGIGEIGITGIVGSIGNAIYNATGVRVRDLPMTLDKVMAL
jgi:xanthine dehydrogenase YagR molybdenum-binding subunit